MKESASVRFLYNTFLGRLLLKLIKRRWLSRICGAFLNSRLSKIFIKRFIKNNNIDMSEYISDTFTCFNDCFCRRIKPEARPINYTPEVFISPCDGLLSVYPISDGVIMPIKQSSYTVASLLRNNELAEKYKDGLCLVFRLCVDNYHRYHYFDNAVKGENVYIKGFLHTVRPTALEALPVYLENSREEFMAGRISTVYFLLTLSFIFFFDFIVFITYSTFKKCIFNFAISNIFALF